MTGTAALIAVSERVLAELRATRDMVRRDLAQCSPMPELDRMEFRLAELEAAYRRGLEDAVFRAVGPALDAPVLAAVPDAPHRHRRPRAPRPRGERPMWPAAVKGFVPVGALGAILKHAWKPALRHHALKVTAWAAHPAHILGITAAVAAPVVLVTAAVHMMSPSAPPSPVTAAGGIPAPAATAYAAVPITSPLPGAPVVHGGADVRSSGQIAEGVPAPWFAASSASPSASASPSPAAGTLSADMTSVDLSVLPQTTITLTATGGPVSWHAWCDSPDVLLGSAGTGQTASGTALPGQPSVLLVSPAAVQDGAVTASCHIWPGSITVTVTLPLPASASPSPSPPATDMDPSPSPDPTSS